MEETEFYSQSGLPKTDVGQCINYLSACCDKVPDKGNLWMEKLSLAHTMRMKFIMVRTAFWKERDRQPVTMHPQPKS